MSRQTIEGQVEAALAHGLPDVDLREVRTASDTLRVVIDHPAGVDHGLCIAATRALERAGLLERYGIEVSSPGPEPPLRTIDHYRRAVGDVVSLRVEGDEQRARSVTGTLSRVERDRVELTTEDGGRWIPTRAIRRARVVQRSAT